MHRIDAYHRPTSVAAAVDLLALPNHLALAGGTTIRHDGGADPTEVVDLQALGLNRIAVDDDVVRIDVMVTLDVIAENHAVPGLIRTAAHAELPSTLRTLATIGGTIGAACADSLLLTALLVHDATVSFADGRTVPLQSVLSSGLAEGEFMLAVDVHAVGHTALAQTGRTPSDDPIVAAMARSTDTGVRLALCGVGPTPQLVDPDDLDRLDPPGDFRGSSEYRRHLAQVLSARVLEELS